MYGCVRVKVGYHWSRWCGKPSDGACEFIKDLDHAFPSFKEVELNSTVGIDNGSGEIFGDCVKRGLRNTLAYTILRNTSVFVESRILIQTALVDVAWLRNDEFDFVIDV